MNNANTTEAETDRALRWAELAALSREAARAQAIEAMRYNGNGPECLPHLACGGCGCDECLGGAVKCGCCVHRVAVTTVADGTPEGMDVCGWCADAAKAAEGSDLEVANVKSPTGEPSRASGAVSFGAEVAAPLADESRAAKLAALDRAWLAAGAEIRAERARGAA